MSEKTYVFGEGSSNSGILSLLGPLMQQKGIDPNVLLAMKNNNGFGGEGGWFIWILFLVLLGGWGNGYGGFGGRGNGFLANELNNDFGRNWLLQAIDGNGDAIQQLATTLHCDVNQIQNAINGVQTSIQSVSSQVGLSSSQIINAIQSGNATIASQIASCCCETKNMITTQGYENRIATAEQTAMKQGFEICVEDARPFSSTNNLIFSLKVFLFLYFPYSISSITCCIHLIESSSGLVIRYVGDNIWPSRITQLYPKQYLELSTIKWMPPFHSMSNTISLPFSFVLSIGWILPLLGSSLLLNDSINNPLSIDIFSIL